MAGLQQAQSRRIVVVLCVAAWAMFALSSALLFSFIWLWLLPTPHFTKTSDGGVITYPGPNLPLAYYALLFGGLLAWQALLAVARKIETGRQP